MLKSLSQMLASRGKERIKEHQDAVLGTLQLAEENWWQTTIAVADRSVGFKIRGESKPDPALIEHARDIVGGFAEFSRMVGEFLAIEARRMPGAADEIRQLVIEDVMLFWTKRTDDGMIYFRGPDKYRVWRCDYVGRKPRNLGFDD